MDSFNQITNMTFVPNFFFFFFLHQDLMPKEIVFVSWHPEPGATAIGLICIVCLFFPFGLISPVLVKIGNDKVLILVPQPGTSSFER